MWFRKLIYVGLTSATQDPRSAWQWIYARIPLTGTSEYPPRGWEIIK